LTARHERLGAPAQARRRRRRQRDRRRLRGVHLDPDRSEDGVLASVGSVGDAYDNALAESFVDSFKTELISDRIWQTRSQLELAVVDYFAWFNTARLHQALGDLPPAEFEAQTPSRFETITDTERMLLIT
jgi:putative transposase